MTGVILLGPPGVGKGTQARVIGEHLGVPTISTGNIFRSNIQAGTALGQIARDYLDRGAFVPDSITTPMIAARLEAPDVQGGFLLDGYPRTLEQAHALRDILAVNHQNIDVVIVIDAAEDVLVARMEHRAEEEDRSDDRPEVFQHRLTEYTTRTEPIATYYAEQDLLESVDGSGTVEEVSKGIFEALASRGF